MPVRVSRLVVVVAGVELLWLAALAWLAWRAGG